MMYSWLGYGTAKKAVGHHAATKMHRVIQPVTQISIIFFETLG
jgi:hypothetical protein